MPLWVALHRVGTAHLGAGNGFFSLVALSNLGYVRPIIGGAQRTEAVPQHRDAGAPAIQIAEFGGISKFGLAAVLEHCP